jgi:hypothetical protein
VLFVGLWWVSRWDYLLFHTTSELFSALVAFAIFIVAWHSKRFLENDYLLVIGMAYLFLAPVTVLHALAYKGMNVFPIRGSNLATQLWLVSRYIQATAFLAAPFMIGRRPKARRVLVAFGVFTALLLGLISLGWFPAAFVEGRGLTPFKIASEYLVMIAMLGAVGLLLKRREAFAPAVLTQIAASLVLSVLAEVAFTLYTDPFGPANFVGHLFYIVAFFLIYQALVRTALEDPYAVLFREIKQREGELAVTARLGEHLNAINADINSTLDFESILRRVTVTAARALGSDAAVLTIKQGDRWVIQEVHGYSEGLVGVSFDSTEARHMVLATESREPLVVNDAPNDTRLNSSIVARFDLASLLTAPLWARDEPIGVLSFHYHRPHDTQQFEVDFARKLAASISLAIDNARLYQADHEVAETLQAALLSPPREMPGLEIGYAYHSSPGVGRIGGDFCDVFEVAEDKVAFVIGDVCGKGIRAAATTAMVRSTIRAFAYREPDPCDVIRSANMALERQLGDSQFVTAIYGTLDPSTGNVRLVNAGHPDPFVCGPEQGAWKAGARALPLGVFPGTGCEVQEFRLNTDDVLLMFTDGVLEARGASGFFGEEGVSRSLSGCRDRGAAAIVSSLLASVMDFSRDGLRDDVAIIAIRYLGRPGKRSRKTSPAVRLKRPGLPA